VVDGEGAMLVSLFVSEGRQKAAVLFLSLYFPQKISKTKAVSSSLALNSNILLYRR
jgi:hypothetical protein